MDPSVDALVHGCAPLWTTEERPKGGKKRKITNFNKPEIGVGTELSKILSILGFKVTENCSCKQRAKVMNWLGLEWCLNNQKIILDWLQQEANNRKVPFIKPVVNLLLKKAINNYKKQTRK